MSGAGQKHCVWWVGGYGAWAGTVVLMPILLFDLAQAEPLLVSATYK